MKILPSYKKISEEDFAQRLARADEIIKKCTSCPRNCLVDRTNGELGTCQSRDLPIVSSYTPHFGEEPVLSGSRGAGNIFFGNCNLRCDYCQNFVISQNPKTEIRNEISNERLADIMIELQSKNCHNIGLVSPTHFTVPILKSIKIAIDKGLILPIIYNSNGYDSVEMLKLYEDVIDIYLPDFKYTTNEIARKYSDTSYYPEVAISALKRMYYQKGSSFQTDENGTAQNGILIRHLVLPDHIEESKKVLGMIAEELSTGIHVSLMSQYHPIPYVNDDPSLNRPLYKSEYLRVAEYMEDLGFRNGWIQDMDSYLNYRPDFRKKNPFV